MSYCRHCKVNIRGQKDTCVLCENMLESDNDNPEQIYPEVMEVYENNLAMKILIFISIVGLVVSFTINIIFSSDIRWSILFMFAVVSVWIGFFSIAHKRYHIPKKILWQVLNISALAVFWDLVTGWSGWSLEFVFPIICISAMVLMYITAKIMRLSIRDYITYALLDSIFGIIPVIFIYLDLINWVYLSIISVGFSMISLSALLIFHGAEMKHELNKRMHL